MTDEITNTGITVRASVRDATNPTRKAHNLTWNDMLEVADTALQTGAVSVGPYAPDAPESALADIKRDLATIAETTQETNDLVESLSASLADAVAEAIANADIDVASDGGVDEEDVRAIAEKAAEETLEDHSGGGW